MKFIPATLLAAQRRPHRLPYVAAEVRDFDQGIKRLAWQRLYTGTEPENHHGIAFDGNGDMHRIRAEGTSLYYQKQHLPFATAFPYTFPVALGDLPSFGTWTQLATDCAGPCAIAASGEKVYIFYRRHHTTSGERRVRKLYSHDYGATWTNQELVNYLDVISMAACWWGTTDNVVCFTLRTNEIGAVVLDTSTQAIVQHRTVSFTSPHTIILTDSFGIGATFDPFWPQCSVVFAGLRTGTPYNQYSLFITWLSSTYHFGTPETVLISPEGEDITYEYPECHLPAGAQDYETNRVTFVEKYAGVAPYDRPLACHMVKDTYWSDAAFTEPGPFLDIGSDYGLRMQSTTGYYWLSRPDGVWRARRPAEPPIDISRDIISLSLQTYVIASPELASGRGNLVIELDNSKGKYNVGAGLVPALINKRIEVELRLGYRTTAGDESLEAGTFWIDSWEHSSEPNRSVFTLYCLDGWSLANRWTPRYQMSWNQPGMTPHSVWQILYSVLARIGIRLSTAPPRPRSNLMDNFQPEFTLIPGQRGDTAIRRLLAFVPDQLIFLGQYALVKDPRSTETAAYAYGTDHAVAAGRYGDAVTASWTRALGQDSLGDRIVADAIDWEKMQLFDCLAAFYDSNIDTATLAADRAAAALRTLSLDARRTQIVIPTNVGQEVLDVVEVTDARCGIVSQRYRVNNMHTHYDRRRMRYEQTLALGAP